MMRVYMARQVEDTDQVFFFSREYKIICLIESDNF